MNYIHPLTNLSQNEYQELLGLEYVLIWGYSEKGEEHKDEARYKELSNKRWGSEITISSQFT